MSDLNEQQQLPNPPLMGDELVVEIPGTPPTPYIDRIPFGYDPIGEVYLRGRASRGFVGGRIPWWVIMGGWFMFGLMALTMVLPVLFAGAFEMIPTLLLLIIPLIILWRGTHAKLAVSKTKKR